MPGDWLPRALHAGIAAEVKAHLLSKGHRISVAVAASSTIRAMQERVVATGMVDMVGIARGLLADPDWPIKVRKGEADRIVQCDYCNVCKALAGEGYVRMALVENENRLRQAVRQIGKCLEKRGKGLGIGIQGFDCKLSFLDATWQALCCNPQSLIPLRCNPNNSNSMPISKTAIGGLSGGGVSSAG